MAGGVPIIPAGRPKQQDRMDMMQTSTNSKSAFKPGDPTALEAARHAPRATPDQKTSLATKEGGDMSLAKIGQTLKIGHGKRVDFYYTTGPNEHGFFVTFREVTDKHGNTEMKGFAGRRMRKAAKALCERRYEAAKTKADA